MIYKILAHIIHRRRPLLLAVVVLAVLVSQHQRPTLPELAAVRATIYPQQNQPQNQGVKHHDGK